MEYLVDLLLLGAIFLVYRSGRQEVSSLREDLTARVSRNKARADRTYIRNKNKIDEHIRGRMH